MFSFAYASYDSNLAFADALRHLLRNLLRARPASARAQEAADVRALARDFEKRSPGFAADLYAAASRHEGLPA